MKKEILTNRRFGRLLVTTEAEPNKYGHTRWNCRCDCGNEIVALASDLKRGGRPSCSCLKREKIRELRKLPLGEGAINQLFGHYRKSAKERNIAFLLTITEFKSLIDKTCHYCGVGATLKVFGENRMKQCNVNGNFTYTGIDRKNSNKGYELNNCVTCCKTCNFAKNDMSYEEFIDYLDRLASYRSVKQEL